MRLPSTWTEQTLSETAEIVMGQSPPGSSYNESGEGSPFFQGKAEFGALYPTVRKWTTGGNRFARADDILMSVRAPVGPTNLANVDCVIGRGLAAIRAKSHVNQTFLLWFLRSFESEIAAKGKGTTFDSISGDSLRLQRIAVPPLVEQEKIVEILEEQLSRLDAAAVAIAAARTKAARFRLSVIESSIHGDLSEQFATAWDDLVLNDLVEEKSDIVDGPFGSNLKSEHYVASGARVIRLQNIGYGDFRDDAAFISFEHFERLKKHNVQTGDLLFASLGENLPRTCLVPNLDTPAIVKADCIRVRLSKSVSPRYVLMATQAPTARSWAVAQLHGLGRPRLGLGNIRQFPVRVPSIKVQERIVEYLDFQLEISSQIEERCSRHLNLVSALRRSLLQRAFTGQLTASWRKSHDD
jgi:type I restriction enzyme S subunit